MSDFYSKITAPIAGDDPFGADVNYDVDFENLKSEMGKLGGIDTEVVEILSVKILTKKCKDARVLAFLSYAMLRQSDIGRLADVFLALAEYCENNFENIHPRREKAKISALRWFSESRFSGQCEKVKVTADDVESTARLVEAFAKLKAALDSKCSDGGPPLSYLYRWGSDWQKAAQRAANPPEPVKPPPSEDDTESSGGGDYDDSGYEGGEDSGDDEITGGESTLKEILKCLRRIEKHIINLKQETVV